MDNNGKITIPSLIPVNVGGFYPVITLNQNILPQQQQYSQPFKPQPYNTYPIIQTIIPGVNMQQNVYQCVPEDPKYITLGGAKNVSDSAPRFSIPRSLAERSFEDVCADQTITLSPKAIGFIPSSVWRTESISFGSIVSSFFRRRNSTSSKFPYKLYNALLITEHHPQFFPHIGVKWITDSIIWVNREAFARLLGVKTIEGSLFHQQGNFPSHGFEELSFEESSLIAAQYGLGVINLSVMRLVKHSRGIFKRGLKERDLERCKWKGG